MNVYLSAKTQIFWLFCSDVDGRGEIACNFSWQAKLFILQADFFHLKTYIYVTYNISVPTSPRTHGINHEGQSVTAV